MGMASAHSTRTPPGSRVDFGYRPALDGLRCLAVYLVLAFHARVDLFAGGFIGVDLFFVLSGFLVSSLLLQEAAATGTVDVPGFFARRVRRLLPAAAVVVVATAVVSTLFAGVVTRLDWIGDARSALLYYSNWHFLAESNDYFGANINKSPYLHFWSLSIEEQFYFVFPVLLWLIYRRARSSHEPPTDAARTALRVAVAVVLGLTALSLLAQAYWALHDPNHAYYGTDARLYQPLAGVLAALVWRRHATTLRGSQGLADRGAGRGAVVLLLVLLLFLGSGLFSPSVALRGFLATVFSVLLILSVMAEKDRLGHFLLTRRPIVYLGKISYGTYLWHWPVIVTLLALFKTSPLVVLVLTFDLATGLAALSYELLERPIRTTPVLAPFRVATPIVGVTCSALIAVTLVPWLLGNNQPPALRSHTVAAAGKSTLPRGAVPADLDWKKLQDEGGVPNTFCTLEDLGSCLLHEGGGPRVMLVGDSHSRMTGHVLQHLAEEHDFTLYGSIVGRCSWFPHTTSVKQNETEIADCHAARDHLYPDLIKALDIDIVVLTQFPRELTLDDNPTLPYPQLAATSVREVTDAVASAGARSIIVATWLETVDKPLDCLASARDMSACEALQRDLPPEEDAYYRTAATESPDVAMIDINPIMCPNYPACAAILDGLPVWHDHTHYLPSSLVARSPQIWEELTGTGFFPGPSSPDDNP